MAIKLEVPLVLQRMQMSCWYASACMVAYYRVIGPRLGLPDKWVANNGITASEFARLAKAEGLKQIPTPIGKLTAQHLEVFLRNFGPIWCAGYWDGTPHIVVLTGVDGNKVNINDPNPVKGKRIESLEWFNLKLARNVSDCMMYMPRVKR